jgi:hypothetical protein
MLGLAAAAVYQADGWERSGCVSVCLSVLRPSCQLERRVSHDAVRLVTLELADCHTSCAVGMRVVLGVLCAG